MWGRRKRNRSREPKTAPKTPDDGLAEARQARAGAEADREQARAQTSEVRRVAESLRELRDTLRERDQFADEFGDALRGRRG